MHPALSVIFFTTLSGAGYGLWFLLGLGIALGWWPRTPYSVLVPLILGLVLVSLGLLASLSHLGQPQRAWRAFSQWRSSWLSREGVVAVATYVPALGMGVLQLTSTHTGDATLPMRGFGAMLVLGSAATVFCTARIYSSLKTIPAWHNRFVLPVYLLLALYSGGLWLWALAAIDRRDDASLWTRIGLPAWMLIGMVMLGMLATLLKLLYWHRLDAGPATASAESATGLGRFGHISSFERPHTEENYITREMGFILARKHAPVLRALSLLVGFGLPLVLVLGAIWYPPLSPVLTVLALAAGSAGIFLERWLFFAQARHVVNLYYGARQV